VAIGKMLNLGGIDNKPSKADQSLGRFRVARNVYPTPDNRLIPRYHWSEIAGQSTKIKAVHHITPYDSSMLSMTSFDVFNAGEFTEELALFKDQTIVPKSSYTGLSPFPFTSGLEYSQAVMSYRRNNTTYFLQPYGGELTKYDGVEYSYAGCNQPIVGSSSYNATGTKYIRVIQHRIDFDNNEPASEYVQFPVLAATTSVQIRSDGGATNLIGSSGVTPSVQIVNKVGSDNYFRGTAAYVGGGSDHFAITTSDTNMNSVERIGSYVIVEIQSYNGATYGIPSGYAIALKVKSVSPLVLDAKDAKYLSTLRVWESVDIVNGTALASAIVEGTRNVFSIWASASSTGTYYFMGIGPAFPNSGVSKTYNVTVANPPTTAVGGFNTVVITLGPILGDIYDGTSKKLSPNTSDDLLGGDRGFYCMGNYQDLLLLANDDLIWFSDTSLGGAFGQLNALNFLKVGDKEFGRVTSIAGTQDFLFVSRERKNYYIVGNIATGNYRVQEISSSEIGAWSNNSSIVVKDAVFFVTALGVFLLESGGRCSLLSKNCPKNFSTYDSISYNEDVSFILSGFSSSLDQFAGDTGLSLAYDEYRELLIISLKSYGNPSLVIHTKTGEFYEWDGLMNYSASQRANTVAVHKAEYYFGGIVAAGFGLGAKVVKENKSIDKAYVSTHPVKLYTTWLTSGEPSLEKQLLQLKMFGRFKSDGVTSGIGVYYYKDWNLLSKISNESYFPLDTAATLNSQVQYSHKKRLTSDKVLSASVGIEVSSPVVAFELESIEVEFNPIQSGMKK